MVLILLGLIALFGGEKWLGGLDSSGDAGVVWNWIRPAREPELTGGVTIDLCL